MGPTDVHHVISSGPYTVAPGATGTVGFALVAGDSSLANLQQNADAAKAKWSAIRNPTSVVKDPSTIPYEFSLKQNYPNPFNPSTRFEFEVPSSGFVSLKVFDLLGREVATVAHEEVKPGSYRVQWNAEGFSSGVYLYRLHFSDPNGGRFVDTKKLILLR